jgi:hypothetical protein
MGYQLLLYSIQKSKGERQTEEFVNFFNRMHEEKRFYSIQKIALSTFFKKQIDMDFKEAKNLILLSNFTLI